ncbi:ANTAR domain-containing protein [Kineosporia mesophila]|uniref:ANTAR domain-containing protein n=1 Tax=Kineosporia mesophila TaxID=566012 RepID=A0ABP6ZCV1_9ACTN|nr:ANTAR domain-containing protein [Kineosporia mesophila]MCD5354866.1 ANTAR domain-containing protein [Kineosporia mesophila]
MTIREFGNDLLTSLLEFTRHSVPGAVGVGLSVAMDSKENEGTPQTIAAIGVAGELDVAQWKHAQGPIWDAFRRDTVIIRPTENDDTGLNSLPGVGSDVTDAVRGAIFVPGEFGSDLPTVFSVYLDRVPDDRVLRDIDRYEPLVTQALAVVEYCAGEEQVAQQMLQMTQYRRVIEQAKGLVMGAIGADAPSAFAALARASQHFNIRLRTLAVALVEHVGRQDAEHPADPELVVRPTPAERETAARIWAALTTSAILEQK